MKLYSIINLFRPGWYPARSLVNTCSRKSDQTAGIIWPVICGNLCRLLWLCAYGHRCFAAVRERKNTELRTDSHQVAALRAFVSYWNTWFMYLFLSYRHLHSIRFSVFSTMFWPVQTNPIIWSIFSLFFTTNSALSLSQSSSCAFLTLTEITALTPILMGWHSK